MDSLCLDFLNSDWRDFRGRWREERLLQPEWLEEFLTRWNLQVTEPISPRILNDLLELRTLMRRIVESLRAKSSAVEDLDTLNSLLHDTPFVYRLLWHNGEYRMEAVPLTRDWRWVMAEIVTSFADLLVRHDSRRLKICENPYCCGIFYDESKSRSKRWCTNDKCANLWKVRRFRTRKRSLSPMQENDE